MKVLNPRQHLSQRGFTLIELLVVIAIIAILAAILFPVFARAKSQAQKMSCMTRQNQNAKGIMMYTTDNEESMVMANLGGNSMGWGFGRPDYCWPELVMPYVKNWTVFRCPSDPNATDRGLALDSVTEAPLPPGHPNYFYAWGARSSVGLNMIFLSPWVLLGSNPTSQPTRTSRIEQASRTILFLETLWDRVPSTGKPKGGGNWTVEAPCVRDSNNNSLVPTSPYYTYGGWRPNPNGTPPFSWLEFGGAWPWHYGMINVAFCDGSSRTMSIRAIAEGCNVVTNAGGQAFDGDKYLWDLR
ncbi:MAG TPA: prepilin-type N-terminal cleavage/methylation domain-containing protein [Fimbriimonadaceae bacterium]|nr:prepilin-type N-terminal cleavage/methylation domain-containing protein [Fimbriimonadaceae bacterium]HRJ32776.1 prepilin-type N-terminal cleavage/methylation domain-containing protein [Fimbriimonadaceae bacterium]